MKLCHIRLGVLIISVPLIILAGCQKSTSEQKTIKANKVAVQKATSEEIVLSLEIQAGTRVWLDYWGDNAGLSTTPEKDIRTTVRYNRLKKGFSVQGEGLASMFNSKAYDVKFHKTPVITNEEWEIGTYSQWDTKDNRIVFRFDGQQSN